MTIRLKDTILVLTAITAWALIFIDGATDEGPIIKFIFAGLQTSNLQHKISDIAAILSLLTVIYLLARQDFRRLVFVAVYAALLLNILRHIDFQYFSWFLQTKTILPTALFIILAVTSVLTIKGKASET